MMRENISVCMASYNGSSYIKEQIESILSQLIHGDELIIVDDTSTDNTLDIINMFKSEYIKVFRNKKNKGHVKTFENVLSLAKNDYICLADQDDIWINGRLNRLLEIIKEKKVLLVASNFQVNNESVNNTEFLRLESENSNRNLGNILRIFKGKSAYYGCTMMLNKKLLKYVLPFPTYIEAHDLWMAISANILRSIYHLDDNTLIYRVHYNNSSLKKRNIRQKLKARYYFCKNILLILKRII
ncbi:glycosyltransferase [Chryseobacterium potabilaquae]|uniref:UDP-Glc:alpha-D-GlcNAc-diphosphoundecaprenol beta-1,3-glucosyltransferase WfgD n=1 Tax=Chryseobacterium potabilaquae TaxID=2675057 RepID=A0A6N4X206_9FLAO|nr:glycosyltransferase [Chryseobacterium potabilaquae]CAA7193876.1 UDP-Glc:alpha-D-GlcNAc-diphosphoundecaprenol beta-1,3-glucosyltransferase WfgD [Chryseobacterium potabilaquae]